MKTLIGARVFLPPGEAPDASSKLFREYAAEFVELARNATSAQRFLFLKMTNIWQETAIRWDEIYSRIRRSVAATAPQCNAESIDRVVKSHYPMKLISISRQDCVAGAHPPWSWFPFCT
jgi:hypothetical protein